jgi:hypothetical protein
VNTAHVLWTVAAALAVVVTAVAIHRARQHRDEPVQVDEERVARSVAAARARVAARVLAEPTQDLRLYGERRPPAPRQPLWLIRTDEWHYVVGPSDLLSWSRRAVPA